MQASAADLRKVDLVDRSPLRGSLCDTTRQELARQIASIPDLPKPRIGPKKRFRQREHVRIVRLGESRPLVFLKSYSDGQIEWGLHRIELRVLESLRDVVGAEQPFIFPEPICLLEEQRVLAMTVIPGHTMHFPMLFYGVSRLRTGRLLEWSRQLGRGLALLQRACARLDLDWLAVKEVGPDEVRSKTPSIGVLVDAGLDQIVANDGHLLERTPCGLAHGDLGSRNVLVDHDTLGIVDWGYASIRSVFHDPLHLARGMVFSQRRGVSGKTAMAMAREVLTAWLRASDLPFSPDERKTALQLEHCRSFCADGVAERVAMARPKYAAQLTSLVCDLEI